MHTPYLEVPTYENGEWDVTVFFSREEFRDFVLSLFKEPGLYEFDQTSEVFNEEARRFNRQGFYCDAPFRSRDYIDYWDTQKERCRKGAIYKNNGRTWYLTRDYYMWVNFLPIYDKQTKRFDFPSVWDGQYHMALYELLAELHYKHVAVLKKRQFGSSYFHCSKLINQYWFEQGAVLKMGASMKDYINEKGSWKFLDEYRNFLNEHTAWYRNNQPNKVFAWQQQIEVTQNGRKTFKGLKSVITGITFEKDPTNGVGGPVVYFYHEESGIAPKMDITYEYVRPALQLGMVTTGTFLAAGSVGDLTQCEPLKKMMEDPEGNDIYAVETNLIDNKGTIGKSGLFVPEQWCMPPYIDQYGNSLVEQALKAIKAEREIWKKSLTPEQYQLRISQKPTTIEEAFATRSEPVFPAHLVNAQIKRIEDKTYSIRYMDLKRNEQGKVVMVPTGRLPIMEFPLSKKTEHKEGVVCIYEDPIPNAPFGTYYASIDPVGEGKAEYVKNKVYTPTGRKEIGNLVPGDYVIGSNGKPTLVTGVYRQGIKRLCRVSFNDGFSVLVCEDHLWSVTLNGGTRGSVVLSTKQLMDPDGKITLKGTGRNSKKDYCFSTYYKSSKGANRWSIPLTSPVEFQSGRTPLSIPPYLLGLLIGDGGISTRSIMFTSADSEIISAIDHLLSDDLEIKKVTGSHNLYNYRIVTKRGNRNSLSKKLSDLRLKYTKSDTKFIPESYKYSSVQDRIELLRGLMDTDGYCGNHGAEYYTVSEQLAKDVVELVQSLGGIAKIRKKTTVTQPINKNGKGYIFIVRVILPDGINPFKLTRKAKKYYTPRVLSRYISKIEYERDDEAVCISVDAEDQLYVTEHGIVTHNTTTSESLCSIYVWKNAVEIIRDEGNGNVTSYLEPGKIVASWCGRFDDLKKTHERLEMLIELYNAWTLVENNISLFIQYMISRRKQKYLVPKNMIMFLKELNANNNVFQEYGWKNTGTLFKAHLLSYGVQSLQEELDQEHTPNGEIVKTIYGVERIPDIMLLREMQAYREGLNVDRLVAYCALMAFVSVQDANRGIKKRVEVKDDKLENSGKMSKLYMTPKTPFRHMGINGGPKRSAFKNLK